MRGPSQEGLVANITPAPNPDIRGGNVAFPADVIENPPYPPLMKKGHLRRGSLLIIKRKSESEISDGEGLTVEIEHDPFFGDLPHYGVFVDALVLAQVAAVDPHHAGRGRVGIEMKGDDDLGKLPAQRKGEILDPRHGRRLIGHRS